MEKHTRWRKYIYELHSKLRSFNKYCCVKVTGLTVLSSALELQKCIFETLKTFLSYSNNQNRHLKELDKNE